MMPIKLKSAQAGFFLLITWACLVCLLGITAACQPSPEEQVEAEDSPGFTFLNFDSLPRLDIEWQSQPVGTFRYDSHLYKPVITPLFGPEGVRLTRGYPLDPRAGERVDHPHQVGVWFTFGDVNGLDFWNNSDSIPQDQKYRYGSIVFQEFTRLEKSDSVARISFRTHWVDVAGNILLEEAATYAFTVESADLWTITRHTKLTAKVDSVRFYDNKEGMFAIRVATELEEPRKKAVLRITESGMYATASVADSLIAKGTYYNLTGRSESEVWGTRNKWVMLQSEIDGTPVSLVLFDHPDNPGYPASYHARGYGLFSVCNFGHQAFREDADPYELVLYRDKTIEFTHQLQIYRGHPEPGNIEQRFEEYASKH